MEEQTQKPKGSWGGRRPGSGRKRMDGPTTTICLRIPEDVAKILAEQENRSKYIIEAIREYDKKQRTTQPDIAISSDKR